MKYKIIIKKKKMGCTAHCGTIIIDIISESIDNAKKEAIQKIFESYPNLLIESIEVFEISDSISINPEIITNLTNDQQIENIIFEKRKK